MYASEKQKLMGVILSRIFNVKPAIKTMKNKFEFEILIEWF